MRPPGEQKFFLEAAKRIARRQSLTFSTMKAFRVTSGEIALRQLKSGRSEMDDDIPF
jgi:hypothetical protein